MDELIEQNMGLVVSIVNSFSPKNHTEREDLIDAGRIGLWKALQKYNQSKGNLLSTYAWRPIRWSIIREIKNRKKEISLYDIAPPLVQNNDKLWELYTNDMTDEEKELIELRKQGYKFREMCEILDETPSTVKNKFYKLIARMKEANEDA